MKGTRRKEEKVKEKKWQRRNMKKKYGHSTAAKRDIFDGEVMWSRVNYELFF